MKIWKWMFLTVIIIITLHLRVFKAGGFGVSLGFLLIPIWCFFTFENNFGILKKSEGRYYFFILFLPFINLNVLELGEFLKTYFQFVLSYVLVVRMYQKMVKVDYYIIDKTLKYSQIIIMVAVVIQFLLVIILGRTDLYNFFGDHQLYYQLNVLIVKGRMKGFYLEPSYLGFVVLNIFWVRKYLNIENNKSLITPNLIYSIVSLTFAASAFAYLGLFTVILFEQIFVKKVKNVSAYILTSILFISIIAYKFDFILSLVRFDEFSISPDKKITSAFMRVVLPITIMSKILFTDGAIFGIGFGELDSYAESFFTKYGETSINNSFFLLIGYFGFIAIGLYCYLGVKFFRIKSSVVKSFILLSLINLNNSGAFMTMQYVFIAMLLPFLVLNKEYNDKIINNNGC